MQIFERIASPVGARPAADAPEAADTGGSTFASEVAEADRGDAAPAEAAGRSRGTEAAAPPAMAPRAAVPASVDPAAAMLRWPFDAIMADGSPAAARALGEPREAVADPSGEPDADRQGAMPEAAAEDADQVGGIAIAEAPRPAAPVAGQPEVAAVPAGAVPSVTAAPEPPAMASPAEAPADGMVRPARPYPDASGRPAGATASAGRILAAEAAPDAHRTIAPALAAVLPGAAPADRAAGPDPEPTADSRRPVDAPQVPPAGAGVPPRTPQRPEMHRVSVEPAVAPPSGTVPEVPAAPGPGIDARGTETPLRPEGVAPGSGSAQSAPGNSKAAPVAAPVVTAAQPPAVDGDESGPTLRPQAATDDATGRALPEDARAAKAGDRFATLPLVRAAARGAGSAPSAGLRPADGVAAQPDAPAAVPSPAIRPATSPAGPVAMASDAHGQAGTGPTALAPTAQDVPGPSPAGPWQAPALQDAPEVTLQPRSEADWPAPVRPAVNRPAADGQAVPSGGGADAVAAARHAPPPADAVPAAVFAPDAAGPEEAPARAAAESFPRGGDLGPAAQPVVQTTGDPGALRQAAPQPHLSPAAGAAAAAQVAAAVVRHGDRDRIEVRLDPPELGRVSIDLSMDNGRVTATVSAERPETLDLLRRHADSLQRELSASGFGRADVGFADRGPQPQGFGAGGAGGGGETVAEGGPAASIASPAQRGLGRDGRLDIRM